jgi:hypothetical protein
MGIGKQFGIVLVGVTAAGIYLANEPTVTAYNAPKASNNFGPGPGNITQSYIPASVPTANVGTVQSSTIIPQSMRDTDSIELVVVPKMTRGSSVAVLGFKVKNSAAFGLKDLEISCSFFGSSGTFLKKINRFAYRNFPSKKLTVIDEINFGFVDTEASGISCTPVSVKKT